MSCPWCSVARQTFLTLSISSCFSCDHGGQTAFCGTEEVNYVFVIGPIDAIIVGPNLNLQLAQTYSGVFSVNNTKKYANVIGFNFELQF